MVRLHPYQLTEPISVKEALKDITPSEIRQLSPRYTDYWLASKGGHFSTAFSEVKLIADKPCPTLLASRKGCSKAHWAEPRWLSVSECLKLQSFPSNYKFITSPFKIIGNSVPPLLMFAIANHLNSLFPKEEKTVISLFSGGGGSSMGFDLADYRELLAIDFNKNAIDTFKLNFPLKQVLNSDITKLSSETIFKETNLKKGDLFCLQSSPPCQGFSKAGSHDFDDPRNLLYRDVVRITKKLQPKTIVIENVKTMAYVPMNIHLNNFLIMLKDAGYFCQTKIMNSAYHGVPQTRRRLIIVGVRNDLLSKIA